MKDYIFEINFLSPYTIVDSIKISGAVLSIALQIYPEEKDIIECFKNGGIKFSDLFPIVDNNLKFTFPKLPFKTEDPNKFKERKSIIKKLSFVDPNTLKEIFNNYLREKDGMIILDNVPIVTTDSFEENYNSFVDEPGVKIYNEPIERDNKEIYTEVFTKEYESNGILEFYKNGNKNGNKSGIRKWFVIEIDENCTGFSKKIKTSIAFLADTGISGRRSIGRGFFSVKILEQKENLRFGFNGKGYYYLLSKFIPKNEEFDKLDLRRSSYSFDLFSGLDKNGKPLGIYRYFVPGSILYLKENVTGRVIELNGM
ncbi:MAG: type III-A CRISPR-associated RAMP protein Csm4, partial [Minisyncoccia bacterium]